jgi:uncharacterized membrane protein
MTGTVVLLISSSRSSARLASLAVRSLFSSLDTSCLATRTAWPVTSFAGLESRPRLFASSLASLLVVSRTLRVATRLASYLPPIAMDPS